MHYHRMKLLAAVVLSGVLLLSHPASADASKLYRERLYEPVVLKQSLLQSFYGVPVGEMYLYAWSDSTQSWRLMPFQVDERVVMAEPNPLFGTKVRIFYAISDLTPDDGLFDADDELAFMLRDMGDQAPGKRWIDNDEAKKFERLEIRLYDRHDYDKAAFAYLFRSTTITEAVPTPYEFRYFPEKDSLSSRYYNVAIDKEFGILKTIQINPPFGTGVDIFDRQKIMINGTALISGFNVPLNSRNEYYLKVYPDYLGYTKKPVVRLVRETHQTVRLGDEELEQKVAFYVPIKFYPFCGSLEGGVALDVESINEQFPEGELKLFLNNIRQSWDLSPKAHGMRLYSTYNDGLLIDGIPDTYNKRLDKPVSEWILATGAQGALFSVTAYPDTVAEFYYHDNSAGGIGDAAIFKGAKDTGDMMSWGDHGFSMNKPNSLQLAFLMYFLPAGFNDRAKAEALYHHILEPALPATFTGVTVHERSGIADHRLLYNYPNPFNAGTRLTFETARPERLHCAIYAVNGRRVAVVAERHFSAGRHELVWEGRDQAGDALPSGVYIAVVQGASVRMERKLLLLR